ncbi:MAG: hypothetical protein AAGC81_00545 [Pseudomonadota bacterium]
MPDSVKMRNLAEKLNAMVPLAQSRTGLLGYENRRRKVPLVRIDEFFDGNDEERSLIRGKRHTGLSKMRLILSELETCPKVLSVRIAITEYSEPAETRRWPYANRILVVSSLKRDEILRLFRPLQPSEVLDGREEDYFGVPEIPGGATLFDIGWNE